MVIIEKINQGIPFFVSDGIEAAGGVVHGFSTRVGGVSEGMWAGLNLGVSRGDDPDHVRENCRRFFAAIGADGGKLARSNQVHGDNVRVITSADCETDICEKVEYEADALITAIPGVALMVTVADCVPILLYDPVRRVIAAVHSGWRGTAKGVVTRTVERMVDVYGCCPRDILAAIGPSIGPEHFETHEDVPNAMMAALATQALQHIQIKENGKFSVDLKGLNRLRLEQAGLESDHIAVSTECTACNSDRYWSHRKSGNERGAMAAAIQLL